MEGERASEGPPGLEPEAAGVAVVKKSRWRNGNRKGALSLGSRQCSLGG